MTARFITLFDLEVNQNITNSYEQTSQSSESSDGEEGQKRGSPVDEDSEKESPDD